MSAALTSPAARSSLVIGVIAVLGLIAVLVWGGGDDDLPNADLGGHWPVVDVPPFDDSEDFSSDQGASDAIGHSIVPGPDPAPAPAPRLPGAPNLRDLPGGAEPLDFSGDGPWPDACEVFSDGLFEAAVPSDLGTVDGVGTGVTGGWTDDEGNDHRDLCGYELRLSDQTAARVIELSFEHPRAAAVSSFDADQDRVRNEPGFVYLGRTDADGRCFIDPTQRDHPIECRVAEIRFSLRSYDVTIDVAGAADPWYAEVLVPLANNVSTRLVNDR